MRVLAIGTPFWAAGYPKTPWVSPGGHEVRTLAVTGEDLAADYTFSPEESAAEVTARISRDWSVDLLYCVCPEHRPPPRELEHCPVKTVAVISDWNLHQPTLAHNLARFDVVISDRGGSEGLEVTGATPRYVQPVYSHVPAVHYPREVARDIDVLFLGNLNHAIHRARGHVLEAVAALADRYRVVIHGGLPPEEYATMLSRARIAINYGVRHEMNLRCFEAAACGAMLMIEQENLETGDWLPDNEAAVFYDEADVAETVVRYLEDEPARARIAAEGLRRAPALAMENRIDAFLDFAASQPQEKRAFTKFDAETQAIATGLFYAGSHSETQRAWALENLPHTLSAFDSAAAHLARAGLALEAREVRAALGHLQEASVRVPEDATPWLMLARVAERTGDGELERRWLGRAASATQARLAGFYNAPVTNPWFAGARVALAYGEPALPVLRGAALARMARLAHEGGDHEKAAMFARRSLDSWPVPGEPYRVRGDALRAVGNDGEAAVMYVAASCSDPFDDAGRMAYVEILRKIGNESMARDTALESATIFGACVGGQALADQFRAMAGQ